MRREEQMTANIKKTMAFIIAAVMVCLAFAGIVVWNTQTDNAFAANGETVITLQIDNPEMTVGDDTLSIDDSGTASVIVDDRTLVPVRAIIEAVGGTA
ncbi:MAG: copper amine oxidase N-terminal domain-containing protein [Oscillospiraceae bacterium]|nr:copper amine oxidase N-terminal domain-containing protein [Oscillospiraceae bacterium]